MSNHVYDLLGLGFGPAGIALATAMKDEEEANGRWNQGNVLFLEKQPNSEWQPEMLLPRTDIQHHFFRDFATPRNPRSKYTFANYLKEKDRIFSFGLIGGTPGRIEWSDYVKWVAEQVSENTLYNQEVLKVEPVRQGDQVDRVKVVARDRLSNEKKEYAAKNIVLSTGRRPNIPSAFLPHIGSDIFHSTTFKSRIVSLDKNKNYTFTVVGSGQNAIEIILYLADQFPDSQIYSINRNTGFRLYDLGHFSNEVFFPKFTDYFYSLSKDQRMDLLNEIIFTNYSAVDADVSHELYWKVYEESIMGKKRIHVTKCSEISHVKPMDERYQLTIRDKYNASEQNVMSDKVILCTGFMEEKIPFMLEPLREYLLTDQEGDLLITKDYQLETKNHFQPRIFVNGLTEKTHGISDAASFSMIAVKAGRILNNYNQMQQKQCCTGSEGFQNDFVSYFPKS
ncbi:SidA/IucD/PvdA family monooxygenase [Melghirimyces algeriensis]|uniref:L-lysine N6-monooxygenase MbtG n=1 Tax=Melghirimyces algeriensis TaxID=910412 RepID=A0A521D5E5_9BACL|nr:SidA/IucD/PvdA family monooxygenase [Melghirimyces algeriensis]SMO66923.1 L-ornithine N5-oxygenase [Melghirimyces algeriensis]